MTDTTKDAEREEQKRLARERMQRLRAERKATGYAKPLEPVEKLADSIPEAARMLGIAPNTAYRAVATGELPSVKIGGRILVPRAALKAMLAKVGE